MAIDIAATLRTVIKPLEYTNEEIQDAQMFLDTMPDDCPFWDTEQGQETLRIKRQLGINPATTNAQRLRAYNDRAPGGDHLLGQLTDIGLECVATLCNTTADHAGFRIAMRAIPRFDGEFTLGDAARAYARYLLEHLEGTKSA